MKQLTSSFWGGAVGIALFFLTGCGSSNVMVEGEVMVDGQPFKPGPKEQAMVTYLPDKESLAPTDATYPAPIESDGKYRIPGPDKMGIPPGKYRVAVTILSAENEQDLFRDAYSPSQTKLRHEVSAASAKTKLELKKP